MKFEEPKVEFVTINVKDVIACSVCQTEEMQASYEMCGCTDNVTTGQVPCDSIV